MPAAQQIVEPLTRCNTDGQLYARLPEVERQLAEIIDLDPGALRARLDIVDQDARDYLKEEALVYLIRRAYARDKGGLVDDLTGALLSRCPNLIRRHLGSLGPEAIEEGSADFAAALFTLVLDGNRGDFLQVRFWLAVQKLAIRVFGRLLRAHQHAGQTVSLSSIAGYEPDAADTVQIVSPSESEHVAAASDEELVITTDLIRDALGHVKEPYRTAFLLRHYAGWPVEDQDPHVPTISRKFNVDPRTIRNWLKRAEDALHLWRGKQAQ